MAKKFQDSEKDKAQKSQGSKYPGQSSRNPRRSGPNPKTEDRQFTKGRNMGSKHDENSFNDLSWYSHNPELLASAAMLAFPNKPGMDLHLPDVTLDPSDNPTLHNVSKLPGIMQIKFDYTIGMTRDVTSPASIAAKELFGIVRSKFSSSLGYDAPDLFMYMIALDQIHAYLSYLKRLYRVINAYSPQNFYLPEKLCEAVLGYTTGRPSGTDFVYHKFVDGKVKLWNYINTLINMTNKFTFPDQFDIFSRHRWLNEYVYTDAPTAMGQMYVFVPNDFFMVDDTGANGTALYPISQKGPSYTSLEDAFTAEDPVQALFEYGRQMIDALSNWEDAYTINGHFLRAFEGSTNFSTALLLQDEILDLKYVPEVLTQIHNINVIKGFQQSAITQDPSTNAIIYTATAADDDYNTTIIDLDTLTPTPAEVTIATRLTAVVDKQKQIYCGSEVVTSLWITNYLQPVHINLYRNWTNVPQTWIHTLSGQVTLIRDLMNDALLLADWAKWFKAPLLYRVFTVSNEHTPTLAMDYSPEVVAGDVTNATSVNFDFLSDLHRVCLYSEFNCFGKLK